MIITGRCAILRFTKLEDKQVLKRMKEVMDIEGVVNYTPDGLEALLFTAQVTPHHYPSSYAMSNKPLTLW
jgi:DNA polymerase III delta prime subunit